MCKKEKRKYFDCKKWLCYNDIRFMMKGKKDMKKYFKASLCLVLSLLVLLGCSKQSTTTSSNPSKEEKTTLENSETKAEVKTATFVNDTRPGFTSTLTYSVEGDKVLKQSGHNIYDPESYNKTPEELKTLVEETYKGYNGIKGVRQTIEIQDGKVVQDAEFDFTVTNIDELRKAFPKEYSGVGKTISFAASKKLLTELGFTEKTD